MAACHLPHTVVRCSDFRPLLVGWTKSMQKVYIIQTSFSDLKIISEHSFSVVCQLYNCKFNWFFTGNNEAGSWCGVVGDSLRYWNHVRVSIQSECISEHPILSSSSMLQSEDVPLWWEHHDCVSRTQFRWCSIGRTAMELFEEQRPFHPQLSPHHWLL